MTFLIEAIYHEKNTATANTVTPVSKLSDMLPQTVNDVVFVDDIALNRTILGLYLKNVGITSQHEFSSATDALAYLDTHQTDLILTDMWMPAMNGQEFAVKVKEKFPDLPVVAITADTDTNVKFDMSMFTAILPKPVTVKMLKELLKR